MKNQRKNQRNKTKNQRHKHKTKNQRKNQRNKMTTMTVKVCPVETAATTHAILENRTSSNI